MNTRLKPCGQPVICARNELSDLPGTYGDNAGHSYASGTLLLEFHPRNNAMPSSANTVLLLAFFLISDIAYAAGKPNVPAVPSVSVPKPMSAAEKKARCEKEWKKYRESEACFAPYRLANGGIKAEAFKHCTEIKQPKLCD
jgi:hypothetical protein